MGRYDDIIGLDRPASKHPKMKTEDRAKIFAPFAALTGFEDVIEEKGTVYASRRILSEEEKADINRVLVTLGKNDIVTLERFIPEKGEDTGHYVTETVRVIAVENAFGRLRCDLGEIPFEDIYGFVTEE